MKKIIKGKLYDTDAAKRLAAWENMDDGHNLGYCVETLYRKKTGEYFLYGEGGPMSKYARAVGQNEWSFGERIMPLTFSQAREWAEEHLGAEEYETIFGAVAEDGSRMQVCYSLSAAAVETIKRRAAEAGVSASAYIESLL